MSIYPSGPENTDGPDFLLTFLCGCFFGGALATGVVLVVVG